jgi:hypothetical protein
VRKKTCGHIVHSRDLPTVVEETLREVATNESSTA